MVSLAGSGVGGFAELTQSFSQENVSFGVLKVLGKDVRQSVESIRPKFVFFTWIGKNVPVLQRARVSVQRPDVEKLFNVRATRLRACGTPACRRMLLRSHSYARPCTRVCFICVCLQGYSIRVDISGDNWEQTFTRDELIKELLRSGGAHAPNHYVFGPNDEVAIKHTPH